MLKSHGGTLCLDDPRSSTKNGTQLIVYTCKDSANQRWDAALAQRAGATARMADETRVSLR